TRLHDTPHRLFHGITWLPGAEDARLRLSHHDGQCQRVALIPQPNHQRRCIEFLAKRCKAAYHRTVCRLAEIETTLCQTLRGLRPELSHYARSRLLADGTQPLLRVMQPLAAGLCCDRNLSSPLKQLATITRPIWRCRIDRAARQFKRFREDSTASRQKASRSAHEKGREGRRNVDLAGSLQK